MTSIEPREAIPQVWTKDFDKKDLGFDFGQMAIWIFEFHRSLMNSKEVRKVLIPPLDYI